MLEDATGLSVNGDVDVYSVYAASLPTSHPSFGSQMHLEMFSKWKAPPIPNGNVGLFIGILSAGNHFSERMAARKSWLQHKLIKSSHVVARFFVALVRENARGPFSLMRNSFCISFMLDIYQSFWIYIFTAWKKGSKSGAKERSRVFW